MIKPNINKTEGKILSYNNNFFSKEVLHKKIFCSAFLLSLFLTSLALAEEVVVEDRRLTETESAHPTSTATVIDTNSAIERVSDVAEMLQQSAGVTIKRYGGLGSYSVILVRGTSPNQVGVYLDGIPISSPVIGVVNLATLPLDSLERIEIYRGTAPLDLGADIGGAVNLITRSIPGGWGFGMSTSYGSFSTFKSDAFVGGTFGNLGGLLFYSRLQSQGDFEFEDDNGTPYNEVDDEKVKRKNNDFASDALLLKLNWNPFSNLTFFVAEDFYRKDSGLPGIGAFQAEEARLSTLRNVLHLGVNYLAGKFELKSRLFWGYTEEEYEDPLGEIGLAVQDNLYITQTYGVIGSGRYFIGNHGVVAVFLQTSLEVFTPTDKLHDVDLQRTSRNSYGGGLQGEIYLFDTQLILVPTLKWERLDSHYSPSTTISIGLPTKETDASDNFFSPHFGIKWLPLDWLAFHGNVGRYWRAPTFYELFGDRGSVIGNPDLEVETGVHYDIGATISIKKRGYLDKLSASYAIYYLQLNDLIAFVQNSQRTAKAENIGEAEILGHELTLETHIFRFVNLTAAYTYQQALDRSDLPYLHNRPLPGRPRNELHLGIALTQPRWGKVFYSFDYMDGNYLDRYGYLEVPARSIHNAGVTITPTRQLSFTFEVKNIGNEQIYDVIGYPLPGTSYFGTVTYKYHHSPAREYRSGENSETGGEEE